MKRVTANRCVKIVKMHFIVWVGYKCCIYHILIFGEWLEKFAVTSGKNWAFQNVVSAIGIFTYC